MINDEKESRRPSKNFLTDLTNLAIFFGTTAVVFNPSCNSKSEQQIPPTQAQVSRDNYSIIPKQLSEPRIFSLGGVEIAALSDMKQYDLGGSERVNFYLAMLRGDKERIKRLCIEHRKNGSEAITVYFSEPFGEESKKDFKLERVWSYDPFGNKWERAPPKSGTEISESSVYRENFRKLINEVAREKN